MRTSAKLLAIYGNECQTVSTLDRRVPALSHFTRLKSGILVGFSALLRQSDDASQRRDTVLSRQGYMWETSWKLRAASCELGVQFI